MRFFVDRLKVKAAARSMHQFCANVRAIFPRDVDNDVVETATVFLYIKICREVFGRRFADRICQQLRENLKYCTIKDVNSGLARICHEADGYEAAAQQGQTALSSDEQFQVHVRSVLRAMLNSGGVLTNDNETDMIARAFKPFDHTVRTIKTHLLGIKRQNRFIMN